MTGHEYMARVAELPCLVCIMLGLGNSPAEVHHVQSVRGELTDFLTVPLCPEHHRGASGVHGMSRRAFEMRYQMSALDLVAMTIRALSR